MKSIKVKEVMIPLADYAIVSEGATLYEAVLALEGAHGEGSAQHDKYRAVLVLDESNRLVGKLNVWDVLKGIEPRYRDMAYPRETPVQGFGSDFIKSMLETYGLWRKPLSELCSKASELNVREFMHVPSEAEYIREEATLDEAMHQLVVGHHQSLLVISDDNIVGILRLIDVFKAICDAIRACRS
jgi:CBS domain-containing protein